MPVLLSSRLPRSRVTTALLATMATLTCVLPLVVTKNHIRGWALNYALLTCFSLAATIARHRVGGASIAAGQRHRSLHADDGGRGRAVPASSARRRHIGLVTDRRYRRATLALCRSLQDSAHPADSERPRGFCQSVGERRVRRVRYGSGLRFHRMPWPLDGCSSVGLACGCTEPATSVCSPTSHRFCGSSPCHRSWTPSRGETLGRSVLALMAVFQTLQAYPVAGSQVAVATFLMIPVAFVCVHDAFAILERRFGGARGLSWAFRIAMVVAGILLYRPVVAPRLWRAAYGAGTSCVSTAPNACGFPRPSRRYHWLSGTVAANCRALLTLPGFTASMRGPASPCQRHECHRVDDAPLGNRAGSRSGLPSTVWTACVLSTTRPRNGWIGQTSVETLPAYREMLTRFDRSQRPAVSPPHAKNDVRPSGVFMPLVAGRQAFERRRSPLPILAPLAVGHVSSTFRSWIRSTRTGVIVGCQTHEHAGITRGDGCRCSISDRQEGSTGSSGPPHARQRNRARRQRRELAPRGARTGSERSAPVCRRRPGRRV